MTSPPSVVVYYLDASALVKRYATETGSGWITALCQPATDTLIATARITQPKPQLPLPVSSGRVAYPTHTIPKPCRIWPMISPTNT